MNPTARILLLVTLLAGCHLPSHEELIARCHQFGYSAWSRPHAEVRCCSKLNGDDVCLKAASVTKHRRETGQ